MQTLAYLAGGVALLVLILAAVRLASDLIEWRTTNIEDDWND